MNYRFFKISNRFNFHKFFCIQILNLFLVLIFSYSASLFAQHIPAKAFNEMRWRQVGPFRAGWATMAVGITNEPNTYYFGGAGGGVWKTVDAGRTWIPLMQHESASAVGAITLSQKNPQIIYVGTGQVALRYDNNEGDGVYRSSDGGKTWENIGLKDSKHIGRIIVDPNNPNKILVAALGHFFGSNSERGIFLSNDAGKNWKKVLFINDSTGAVDLAFDPEEPNTIYAAMWQMQMHPWLDYYQKQVGNGSGIYKSTDGGMNWDKVVGNGLPHGLLGRIGLAVAKGSSGKIIYATIISKNSGSGLYRSDDGGNNWQYVNSDGNLADSYFSRLTVDPSNHEKVYVMDRSIHLSVDGGKNFTIFKGAPGGDDYHFLWINPTDPTHMITASDQGAVVTVNNGKSWSSWYNQPTGQFYHITADNRFPYRIYSGQQDNGTVEISSRGPYGVIEDRDWHPVGGDERDYDVPKPGNPNLVFGSGLGGTVTRFDEITRQSSNVSPWPISSYGENPTKVKYRYTWITPLEFSHVKPYPLYFGAQVLFRSNDNGDHWKIVSPDLTGKVKGEQVCNDPNLEDATKCGFGTIFCIAPSPKTNDIVWVGTDNGLIQLTKDNCNTWKNTSPKDIPNWARIDAISPSPFSSSTAYVAVNTHRINKSFPLILKTTDFGKSWENISNGIPKDQYVNSVRVDPAKQGLLYAATNRGVYISFDDGQNWQPLQLNLPTVSVRDILVHQGDLIAGTSGRGIWILDNLAPLRELSYKLLNEEVHLYQPSAAWRIRGNENHDTPWPPSTPLGKNPPNGAIIDYWLKDNVAGKVTLRFKDDKGNVIREISSDDKPEILKANRYFETGWLGVEKKLSTENGMHRFVWDLRYPRPKALNYSYSIAAVWKEGTPLIPEGPLVLPGKYTVTLSVDGKEFTKKINVKLDPRIKVTMKSLEDQLDLAREIDKSLSLGVQTYNTIQGKLKDKNINTEAQKALDKIMSSGKVNLKSVISTLTSLAGKVQTADGAPSQGQKDVYNDFNSKLQNLISEWKKIQASIN